MSNARKLADGIKSSADATAITIDSSENVLVGRTSADDSVVGAMIRPDGFVQSTRDGNLAADFNRKSSYGDISRFNYNGSSQGTISVQSDGGILFQADTLTDGIKYSRYGIIGRGYELFNNASYNIGTSAQSVYTNASGTLETAPYIITIQASGGGLYSESWSGIMQWYSGTTNSPNDDTITLNAMGHARNNISIYARTKRFGGNNQTHALQIWASGSLTSVNTRIYATKLTTQGW